MLRGDLSKAKQLFERSLRIFSDLGAHWDIGWALTYLGKVAVLSGEWEEAEATLKRAIKYSLEADAMPQAIDAALELAECFIYKGEFEKAKELVMPALRHPSCTDEGKQRAGELMSILDRECNVSKLGIASLETVLARSI